MNRDTAPVSRFSTPPPGLRFPTLYSTVDKENLRHSNVHVQSSLKKGVIERPTFQIQRGSGRPPLTEKTRPVKREDYPAGRLSGSVPVESEIHVQAQAAVKVYSSGRRAVSPLLQKEPFNGKQRQPAGNCFSFLLQSTAGKSLMTTEVRSKEGLTENIAGNVFARLIRRPSSQPKDEASRVVKRDSIATPSSCSSYLRKSESTSTSAVKCPRKIAGAELSSPSIGMSRTVPSDHSSAVDAKKMFATRWGCFGACPPRPSFRTSVQDRKERELPKAGIVVASEERRPSAGCSMNASPAPLLCTAPRAAEVHWISREQPAPAGARRARHHDRDFDGKRRAHDRHEGKKAEAVWPQVPKPKDHAAEPRMSSSNRNDMMLNVESDPTGQIVWREGLLQRLGRLYGVGNRKLSLEELIELDDKYTNQGAAGNFT